MCIGLVGGSQKKRRRNHAVKKIMMKKREDLKGELLVMKIGSCVCFLESMVQEQKKLKKMKQQEEES